MQTGAFATAVLMLAAAPPAMASIERHESDLEAALFEVGAGISTDGAHGMVAAGYGWGTHIVGMFTGSTIQRVMAHYERTRDTTHLGLTYGWYQNQILATGIDAGPFVRIVDGATGFGPTLRLTLGVEVVAARVWVSAAFGEARDTAVGVDLVFNISELAGWL